MSKNASMLTLDGRESYIWREWLTKQLTQTNVEMVDAQGRDILESREDWTTETEWYIEAQRDLRAFLAPRQVGDELWEFESESASWGALCGRAGYVLLRDGKVVGSYLTRMS